MKIARLYARKTPYDKEDLIQEAFARVLSGRRAWTSTRSRAPRLGGYIDSGTDVARTATKELQRFHGLDFDGATPHAPQRRSERSARISPPGGLGE